MFVCETIHFEFIIWNGCLVLSQLRHCQLQNHTSLHSRWFRGLRRKNWMGHWLRNSLLRRLSLKILKTSPGTSQVNLVLWEQIQRYQLENSSLRWCLRPRQGHMPSKKQSWDLNFFCQLSSYFQNWNFEIKGDSGGPLVVKSRSDGRWHLVGLTSFGPNPCGEGGVYTRLSGFANWIISTMNANGV